VEKPISLELELETSTDLVLLVQQNTLLLRKHLPIQLVSQQHNQAQM
jgi:hypothetical protein